MSTPLLLLLAACGAVAGIALVVLTTRAVRAHVRLQHRLAEGDLASLFIFLDGGRLAMASIALAGALALLCLLLGARSPVAVLAFLGGLVSPRMLAAAARRVRQARLYAQLPDALQAWSGLLGAGHGLGSSLAQLAERQARPLGDELRMLVRQGRMGVPLDASFETLCRRVGARDLVMMSTLLRVTHELGGNLGESLLRLATLLRARQAAESRIRSLTAQGRLQGVIVGLLPLVLLAVLFVMEPAAMSLLFTRPAGWAVLALVASLEIVGFVFIRRIVTIDV